MIPSWASLLTLTTAARHLRFLAPRRLGATAIPPLVLSVPQHRRSFVKVVINELSIRSIIIRWCNPFPWHYAWKSYAYAGGPVDPARCRAPRELLAEVRSEVIAVLGEEVIRGALKFFRCLPVLAIYTYIYIHTHITV
jgi:hypothetical protein